MWFDSLKRVPAKGGYIPELDGLRFFAILGVVLFHARLSFFSGENISPWGHVEPSRWLEYAIENGWYGVQLFFVISGFIITAPFVRHYTQGADKPRLFNYFQRRFKRIEIPYFIALAGAFLVTPLYQGGSFTSQLTDFFYGITYTHNLFKPDILNPLLPVAWTLELEIQFYLLAPLLCYVYKIKTQWLRVGILLGVMFSLPLLLSSLSQQCPSVLWTKNFILFNLPYFLAGMIGVDLYFNGKLNKLPYLWDAIALCSAITLMISVSYWQMDHYMPFILGLLVIAAIRGKLCSGLLSLQVCTIIGGMCYSIYLFHGMLLHLLIHHLPFELATRTFPWNYLNLFFLTIVVFILSVPFYLFIEKPFMQKGKLKDVG